MNAEDADDRSIEWCEQDNLADERPSTAVQVTMDETRGAVGVVAVLGLLMSVMVIVTSAVQLINAAVPDLRQVPLAPPNVQAAQIAMGFAAGCTGLLTHGYLFVYAAALRRFLNDPTRSDLCCALSKQLNFWRLAAITTLLVVLIGAAAYFLPLLANA